MTYKSKERTMGEKLTPMFHCSGATVVKLYFPLLKKILPNNQDYSRLLQTSCDFEKAEVEYLGGEYVEGKFERKKEPQGVDLYF